MNVETKLDGDGQSFIDDDYRKIGLPIPRKFKRRKPTNFTPKKKKRK
jgi:hypothetical protein